MNSPRPSMIGGYEDWPAYMQKSPGNYESSLAKILLPPAVPDEIPYTFGDEIVVDGIRTKRLSWQLGYGPRTAAYLVTPEDAEGPLPAVLLNHCHSGNKFLGAERLVDLGPETTPETLALRKKMYGGQFAASTLASRGFAVLAHDTFAWGSRGFKLDPPPVRASWHLHGIQALWREEGIEETPELTYNATASEHENTISKISSVLGTSFAGMAAHDDLAALNVLRSLAIVDGDRVGTAGASGGGWRSMVVAALSPHVRSSVVSMMLTTYESLFPAYLDAHSWLSYPPGLQAFSDWSLIPMHAVAPSPRSMHAQFAADDELFPLEGMRDADRNLKERGSDAFHYSSTWYDGTHAFTGPMQVEAADFFARTL